MKRENLLDFWMVGYLQGFTLEPNIGYQYGGGPIKKTKTDKTSQKFIVECVETFSVMTEAAPRQQASSSVQQVAGACLLPQQQRLNQIA